MAKGNLVSEKIKLLLALIALQFCYAGFHIVSRVALNIGVSKVVYPVYRNAIALALLSPFAYFLEKNERPPLTFSLLFQFFLLALLGITANQGFYLLGLNYASPTFASAMQNSVPAITFVMASVLRHTFIALLASNGSLFLSGVFRFFDEPVKSLINSPMDFRLEQVNFRRRDGLAKLLGTIGSVGGATVITLYRGPPLLHNNYLTQGSTILEMDDPTLKVQNWRWGCIYLLGHCLSWAGWMVFQASVLKKYPAKLTITSYTCFFGLIQFLVIAGFVETDYQYWKIQSAEELFTILYAGVVASGIVISLQTWCIHKSDPVFVAVFQPLQTFLVAIMAFLILGDRLFSGGVIGAVLITLGLYSVLWGKSKEKALEEQDASLKHPLLDAQKRDREDNVVSDIP